MIAVAPIMVCHIFSTDVNQAFLQRLNPLKKGEFVKPDKEFGLDSNKVLKLKKPQYGLTNSGNNWNRVQKTDSVNDFSNKSCALDPSVYWKLKVTVSESALHDLTISLHAGKSNYHKLRKAT